MGDLPEIAIFPFPSLLISAAGRIVAANEAAESLIGTAEAMGPEALIPQFLASPGRERFAALARDCLELSPGPGSWRSLSATLLRTNGGEQPAEILLSRLESARAPLCLVFLPAGERPDTAGDEDRLSIMALSLDRLNDAIFWIGPDGRFSFVNEAACSSLGYTREELLGMSLHDIDPEFPEETWQEQWAGLKSRTAVIRESTHRRRDGSCFPVEISAHYVRLGGREYNCAVARDTTGRKLLEQKFLQAQKMEAVGRLAGGLAHDFNNLLTVIMGYGEFLLRQLPESDPRRPDVEEICKAGTKAASLTSQLLAFSRRQVLHPTVLNINDTVENSLKMISRLIGEDIEVVTDLDPTLGHVKADPYQVEHILLNLAVNARDAMPEGGRFTIQSENVDLDGEYARAHGIEIESGSYVLLAVTDTGVGMDRETLSQIFEPFFTTKERGKGTGLGLSTIYGVVKQSGGHIWAYSEPGQGTTFKVYLPRVDAPAAAAGPPPEPARLEGSETILLVEDSESLLILAGRTLEACGYQVLSARSAEEALRRCEIAEGPIHLLLTDVVLPSADGLKLAEALRTINPKLRVLYASGYPDERLIPHGLPEQASALLKKPFTPRELARSVRQALDAPMEA